MFSRWWSCFVPCCCWSMLSNASLFPNWSWFVCLLSSCFLFSLLFYFALFSSSSFALFRFCELSTRGIFVSGFFCSFSVEGIERERRPESCVCWGSNSGVIAFVRVDVLKKNSVRSSYLPSFLIRGKHNTWCSVVAAISWEESPS